MPFNIVRQDITEMQMDAIVNAASMELQKACKKAPLLQIGQAAITPGFALPAKLVIHAVGPVYSIWKKEQSRSLFCSAYRKSLKLAAGNGCGSIAFPLISSGIYSYPKAEALEMARLRHRGAPHLNTVWTSI